MSVGVGKLRWDSTVLPLFVHRTFHTFLHPSHVADWHNCIAPDLQLESSPFEFRGLNEYLEICVVFRQPDEANFRSVVTMLLDSNIQSVPGGMCQTSGEYSFR